jgi:hypothetical protein
MKGTKKLSTADKTNLLNSLQNRFEKNKARHKGIEWKNVLVKLEANPAKINALYAMEETGGEPDVVGYDKKTSEYIFYDCAAESPKGRRSICYDHEALEKRKEHKPQDSAMNMTEEMGISILNEAQYRELQTLGEFDLKTSSWIETPSSIRKLGGAIFCDRRYNTVFVYHNGADSYYGARGFRGVLRV